MLILLLYIQFAQCNYVSEAILGFLALHSPPLQSSSERCHRILIFTFRTSSSSIPSIHSVGICAHLKGCTDSFAKGTAAHSKHYTPMQQVNQNKDWTCPICRDICNCSSVNCIRAKSGLDFTNQLWHEANSYGYKSVSGPKSETCRFGQSPPENCLAEKSVSQSVIFTHPVMDDCVHRAH
eukprot:scaffold177943_cov19-Prasinocladus_malaysianus.AAC.1